MSDFDQSLQLFETQMQVQQMDALGSSSSLVPMSRQVLSGRDHFQEIVHTPKENSNHQSPESSNERSPKVESSKTAEKLSKIKLQADIYLESKKNLENQNFGNRSSKHKEPKPNIKNLQYDPTNEKTLSVQNQQVNKLDQVAQGSYQIRQAKQNHRLNTKQQLQAQSNLKVNVINVEVKYDNQSEEQFGAHRKQSNNFDGKANNMAQTQRLRSWKKLNNGKEKVGSKSNRHDRFINALNVTAQNYAKQMEKQRSISTLAYSQKQLNFKKDKQQLNTSHRNQDITIHDERVASPLTTLYEQSRGKNVDNCSTEIRSTTPHLIKCQDDSLHDSDSLEPQRVNESAYKNEVDVYKGNEIPEKGQRKRINEVETKSITVRVGSPVQRHPDKNLRTSLFNKGIVEKNQQKIKPIHQYAYDKSGSLINQHRQRKDPRVSTRISNHNEDLQRQIDSQRDYLIQVMRGRLNTDFASPQEQSDTLANNQIPRISTAVTNQAGGRSAIEVIDSLMKTSDNFDIETTSQNTMNALITQSLIDGFFQKMNWQKMDQSHDTVNFPDLEQYSSSTDSASRSHKKSSFAGHTPQFPPFVHSKSSISKKIGPKKRLSPKRIHIPSQKVKKDPVKMEVPQQKTNQPSCFSPDTINLSPLTKTKVEESKRTSFDSTEFVKHDVMNQIEQFELIGQQMFGIASQKPTKLRKFVSSTVDNQPTHSQNRISLKNMHASEVSQTPDPSNINLDLTGDIYETFGQQNRQESSTIHNVALHDRQQSENNNSSNPTSRAKSYLVSKNVTPKEQDNSIPPSLLQQQQFGLSHANVEYKAVEEQKIEVTKRMNSTVLIDNTKNRDLQSQSDYYQQGSLSQFAQPQLLQPLQVPLHEQEMQNNEIQKKTLRNVHQNLVKQPLSSQSNILPNDTQNATASIDNSTSTLHKMSAISMQKLDQQQQISTKLQPTELNTPFKSPTTGTSSKLVVNGAKYQKSDSPDQRQEVPRQEAQVIASSLFPEQLFFFSVDSRGDIKKFDVSVQQILYEQKDDELTPQQFQQACLAFVQQRFQAQQAREGHPSTRFPVFKYLYDMNCQLVDSILEHIQTQNSSTELRKFENSIFQVSTQKLSNKLLQKNNQILKSSTGRVSPSVNSIKSKKSGKKKNSPLKIVSNASSGSFSKNIRSKPNLLIQGVSHLATNKQDFHAKQGSNTDRGSKKIISKINKSFKESVGQRSPREQNSNGLNELNNSLISAEDSIFSRDNLMKSNFKQKPDQNIKTEEDDQVSIERNASKELFEIQKQVPLQPFKTSMYQPKEKPNIKEHPMTSEHQKRETIMTSGVQDVFQSTDLNFRESSINTHGSMRTQNFEQQVTLPALIKKQIKQGLRPNYHLAQNSRSGHQNSSSFHDYVCSTLLMQAEENKKNKQTKDDAERVNTDEIISAEDKNKYLERFYRNSIKTQAFKNSAGFASKLIQDNLHGKLDNLLLQQNLVHQRLPSVDCASTQHRFNRLAISHASSIDQTKQGINQTALNTMRHSTISKPFSGQSTGRNTVVHNHESISRQMMAQSTLSKTDRVPRHGQTLDPISARKIRLMNPQVSGLTKIKTEINQDFIPATAIKVEHKEKQKQDLPKMKNLFLANCLKIRKGEFEIKQEMENKMSLKVRKEATGFKR